eukprot:SAG11_NODE_134_length_15338_cov_3.876435_14_plen_47_part_00
MTLWVFSGVCSTTVHSEWAEYEFRPYLDVVTSSCICSTVVQPKWAV